MAELRAGSRWLLLAAIGVLGVLVSACPARRHPAMDVARAARSVLPCADVDAIAPNDRSVG